MAAEKIELTDLVQRFRAEAGPDAVCLDLGCGQRPLEGFTGLDYKPTSENVQQCDLFSFPWRIGHSKCRVTYYSYTAGYNTTTTESGHTCATIPDSSVDVVYSSHFVEHVPDWEAFWAELYRVMKHGGRVVMMHPYGNSNRAHQDPTHKQFITEERYFYLDRDWRIANKIDHDHPDVDFKAEYEPWRMWHPDIEGLSDEAREWHRNHSWNAITDLVVFFKVNKPQEQQ